MPEPLVSPLGNKFIALTGERRMITEALVRMTDDAFKGVPAEHNTVLVAGTDIRRDEPKVVVMIGHRVGKHWKSTFAYSWEKPTGHTVSAAIAGSW